MVIRQGDIYWVDLAEPSGSEPGYRRPYVVVQNNVFNQSRINTVVLCALTSNLQRAKSPGNLKVTGQSSAGGGRRRYSQSQRGKYLATLHRG